MRPALAILGVSHSCGSQTDECATPARLDPRRRHGFLTLRLVLQRDIDLRLKSQADQADPNVVVLGYHVNRRRRMDDAAEHLITLLIPEHLAQVNPRGRAR